MTDDLDATIDANAHALGVAIDPAWRESIRFHLALSLRMGAAVLAFDLPDTIDPLPVYRA